MADAGVKAAMVATAPNYLIGGAVAGAGFLAGTGSSLAVFGGTAVTVSHHALRHLPMGLQGEARAAMEAAIQAGRIGYQRGGTFAGRVVLRGKEYFFSGIFRNGQAEVGRISESMRESMRRFVP
jgi:hypothetical protein